MVIRFRRFPPPVRFLSSSTVSTFNPVSKQWPVTCTFDPCCTYNYLKQVEKKWMPITCSHQENQSPSSASSKPLKYVLSMFPYPSGSLHLGHVKVYTSADMISRYLRLKGHPVITPLGWDSFGLPAENAAFDRDLNPADWTRDNINEMRHQLEKLGLIASFREATSDPSFYKWTQYLITQLFDHNLLYRSRALVNWDPVDKTVLADDQVDEDGRSWRSGAKVEKRFLTQWFIKVSRFIDDLWQGKDVIRSTIGVNMKSIHDQQRAFIGKIDGKIFYLKTQDNDVLPVFTSEPSSFMDPDASILISPSHWMAQTDVSGTRVHNPFTGKDMTIQVSDSVTTNWQATIASEKSFKADTSDLNHMESVISEDSSIGGYRTSSSYTDWLISRQRYWGTPIPIVHCKDCGPVPVPLSDLPVVLPPVTDFQALKRSSSTSDVVSSKLKELAPADWLTCSCPKCGAAGATRETDTLDTFVDSSWYYLRYATESSANEAFSSDFWSSNRVFAYLGGPEHTRGHLLTSRMMYHFLRSIGKVRNEISEPYEKFLTQGIINSKSFRDKDGRYLWQKDAEEKMKSGQVKKEDLLIAYEKMSKSKNNGVNPIDLIESFGTDATRITVLGFGNSHKGRFWRGTETEFQETSVFLRKLLLTMDQFIFLHQVANEDPKAPAVRRFSPRKAQSQDQVEKELRLIREERNTAVRDVAFAFEITYRIGLACKKIRALNDVLRRNNLIPEVGMSIEFQRAFGDLIILMSSIAPNISSELWGGFVAYADKSLADVYKLDQSVEQQSYPKLDPDFVNKIKINFDGSEFYFEDKHALSQEDTNVVKEAAIAFLRQQVPDFSENKSMNINVNFLPHMKAIVNIRSEGFDPKALKKQKNKKKKKKKEDEDSDDDDCD